MKRPSNTPSPAWRCKPYFDAVRGLDEPTALQWVDLQTWLPRDILRKADRMSMAHSLELRVPFLDRRVLAVALGLPRRYRCTGRRGKIALRLRRPAACPGHWPQTLSADSRCRWRTGCARTNITSVCEPNLPARWPNAFLTRAALCALLDAHRAGKTNAMTKLWAFYCFIEWYEVYFVEEFPPIL